MPNRSFLTIGCVIVLLFGLLLLSAPSVTNSQGETHNWVALLYRIKLSNNDIFVHLRFDDNDTVKGSILDIGTDYVCLTNSGYTDCIPFEAIGRITTPPGTFGKTSDMH